ncbi:MAG: carboxypeptidase-like regulatory domain-containing protein [Planctomycetota bacterium]|nr:carboxypeptidase-like regulatory domain-containing protein [Planctomycetota bacterium]
MKPLLVLVIVIAAIGALLFAVMNLGGNGKVKPIDTPPIVQSTTADPVKGTQTLTESARPERIVETPKVKPADGLPQGSQLQFDNKLTGVVLNAKNEPVGGAEIVLTTESPFANDPRPDEANEPRTRTGDDGRYSFLGVRPAANYILRVSHPQYAQKRETGMPIAESGPVEQPPIVLTAGGSLSGFINDESGNHLADATLHLDGENYLTLNADVPPDRLTTTTNKEGWYSFVNVPGGQRTVSVAAPGYGKIQVGGFAFAKDEQYTRDFVLKLAEMISGRVMGPNNEPVVDGTVVGVAVSHTQQSGMVTTKTDAKGEFLLENLVPGDYNIIANAKGWRMVQGRNNTRVKTNTSNLVIEMMKEASISGIVIDGASGAPVTNFGVRLRFFYGVDQPTSATSAEFMPITNDKGEFTIDTPGPSDYVVEATAPGFAPSHSTNLSITPGKSFTNVVVKLGRGGSIQGRVVDTDGKPVARARIVTQDNTWVDDEFTKALGMQFPTNSTTVEVRSDDAGRFTLTGLKPELYQLVITATGFTTFSQNNFRVSEAGVTQVGDLKLLRGGTVRGTLFDASGKPISGGTIRLRAIEGVVYVNMSTKTGADGKFALQNCPAGRFQLTGIRVSGSSGNPFEEMMDAGGSQMNVIVAEGDTTTQDLRLQE